MFSEICGMIFALLVSVLLTTNCFANDIKYIKDRNTPAVSAEEAVEILTYASEWPDGTKAIRVHFKENTPQYSEWLYENNLSAYALKQREKRYIALGGKPAIRVTSNAESENTVKRMLNSIGYIFN